MLQLLIVAYFSYERAFTIQPNGYSIWKKKKIFIPLFLQPLMAKGTNTINSEIHEANPNPSLVACSLDQWRIPSVRAFAAS